MAQPLARVVDPMDLDQAAGPRGRLRIVVPAQWLAEGEELFVTVPKRLACARCDGGGCDGCARSGALSIGCDRSLTIRLPKSEQPVQLRLVDPFDDGVIAQLMVEVRGGDAASAGITRVEPSGQPPGTHDRARAPAMLLWLATIVALLVLWKLLGCDARPDHRVICTQAKIRRANADKRTSNESQVWCHKLTEPRMKEAPRADHAAFADCVLDAQSEVEAAKCN